MAATPGMFTIGAAPAVSHHATRPLLSGGGANSAPLDKTVNPVEGSGEDMKGKSNKAPRGIHTAHAVER